MKTLPVRPLTDNPRIPWHNARLGSHYRVCGCPEGMDHYEAVPDDPVPPLAD